MQLKLPLCSETFFIILTLSVCKGPTTFLWLLVGCARLFVFKTVNACYLNIEGRKILVF